MSKYRTLLNILDRIRQEATVAYTNKYNPTPSDTEKTNQARARAFIHLFLKVSFGLLDFDSRENYVTDGTYDGGIDGYYIETETKTIYFIQSKFRTTERNFENKNISLEEILVMDINRILEGEEFDEKGNQYNGKIKQLIRDIRSIQDIARYRYQVILLANLDGVSSTKVRYLTGGYPAEIIDYEKCYDKLLFPVISGTYFNASDLNINIDLSNKNAGSKISYTVQTRTSECEITVLFVPTIELAKILHKYKNSILKYNPRSYLDLEGQKVNSAIRETIINTQTNEFALFNNGITMLSDETFINEKIGQKNKAQLTVKNPQIINGGQTSFTLSRIYEEHLHKQVEKLFENKEVLLKIITLLDNNGNRYSQEQKMNLIDDISTATNQQTPVITADRFSNDHIHVEIQKLLFDRYGVLYERKRGEFGDGLFNQYITSDQVIERNLFFRLYYAANGNINRAVEKKLFLKQEFNQKTLHEKDKLDSFYFGYLCFKKLFQAKSSIQKIEKNFYGQVFAMTYKYKPASISEYESCINHNLPQFKTEWEEFVKTTSLINKGHKRTYIDKETQKPISFFSESKWYKSANFQQDVINYFVHNGKIDENNSRHDTNLEVLGRLQVRESNIKDKIQVNFQRNSKKLEKAKRYLEVLNSQRENLQLKLRQADSENHKTSLEGWISEKETQIAKVSDSIKRYSQWLKEDKENLADLT